MSLSPRARALQLLKDLQIEDPSLLQHLVEICIERGAFVRQAKISGAEARLTIAKGRGIITVQPGGKYPTRTRFSIAHELGHFELHRDVQATLSCDQGALSEWFGKEERHGRESEANEFASELLMPEPFIGPEIRESIPAIGTIQSLARKYQTSLFATTKRFIDLTQQPCIAVFYNKTRITSFWKSHFFDDMSVQIPARLNPATFAYRAAKGGRPPAAMESIGVSRWFQVPSELRDAEILENAKYFPQLDVGISLLWIRDRELIGSFQ